MAEGGDNFSELITSIELNLHNNIIASNTNRAAILYLLKKSPENEMQAERIAFCHGVSHRTALYHLDILERHGYVEVRKFVNKGFKKFRSVWGLCDGDHVEGAFKKINKKFPKRQLDRMIRKNVIPR